MMEKIIVGLLGGVLIICGYSAYQNGKLNDRIDALESELKMAINSAQPAVNANVSQNPVNTMDNQIKTQLNTDNTTAPVIDPTPKGPLTSIKFKEELHEFGSVEIESENLYPFTFTNTGSEPLVISNAKGSCGCTVPNWPKDPIMPGQTGTIDVKFTPNKGQAGQSVEKIVTVTANTEPANTMVRIKADVTDKQ